jgi:hypothetical protein
MDSAHHERLWSDLQESSPYVRQHQCYLYSQNPVFHKRMRHLERRHHFLRDHIEKGDIGMRYIDTERQLVDIFTKPLDASHFAALPGEIGVCHLYGLV